MASVIKNLVEISGLADILPENPTSFKQICVQETLCLPDTMSDMKQLIKTVAAAAIIRTKLIRTPIAVSLEGQILTGFKLTVRGVIRQKIEYGADEITQTVHSVFFEIPFSTFIMLPSEFIVGTPVTVTPYIEDISIDLHGKQTLLENIILLLNAVFG